MAASIVMFVAIFAAAYFAWDRADNPGLAHRTTWREHCVMLAALFGWMLSWPVRALLALFR